MESEKDLAKKLKNEYCYNGVEADPKESATILHKLGLLYKEKSPNKVCLLQSAALLTSGIVRNPDNVKEIKNDLNHLSLDILTLAKATNPNIHLIDDAVKEAKQQIKMLRETVDEKLKYLGPTPDTLQGWRLKLQRKERSKCIRDLQKDITNQYKHIMKGIADHVVSILGKPPCKFSVVGIGSIAKEEITPYSDFEHIIVLEEEILNVKDYDKILEYFRWFATLLQLIIIRFGETVLSFLCIPCLNHPLEEENNWFYDKYTPCGIRPDGFAPHASKNPLGRQTITPNKPWINELIKPVSEMVKYLDSKDGLKEGYHLADMLTKTCFVYGDVITFAQFKMRVQRCHKHKLFGISTVEQIIKDLQQFKIVNRDDDSKLDVKRFFYRGSSLFVHALGKLHGCDQSNGFVLIDKMLQRKHIEKEEYEKLQFCLATACEARLRTYCTASSQNDVHYLSPLTEFGWSSCITDLAKELGSRALVDCLSISQCLQDHVERCLATKTVSALSAVESHKYQLTIAFVLGLFEFTHQLITECNGPPKQMYDEFLYHICNLVALKGTKQYGKGLQQVNIHLRNLGKWKKSKTFLNPFVLLLYFVAASCLLHTGKHKRAIKYLRKANKIMHFSPHVVNKEFKGRNFSQLGRCFFELGRAQRALKYYHLGYKISRNSPVDSINYCWCLISLSKFDEAKLVAENVIKQRKSLQVNEDFDIHIDIAHTLLSVCWQKSGYFKNFPLLDRMYDHSDATAFASSSQDLKFDINLGAYDKLMKFIKQATKHEKENDWDLALYNYKQAEVLLHEFDSLNEVFSNMKFSFDGDCLRVHLLDHIVFSLMKLNRPTEKLIYAKRMFRCSLNQNLTLDDHMRARYVTKLVGALFQCNHYIDCLGAAKHAIRMCQFFACDKFLTDSKFRTTVKLLQICEKKLGIMSSLPYDCSPSVYFIPDKHANIGAAMNDMLSSRRVRISEIASGPLQRV